MASTSPVPVTMGSPRSVTQDVRSCRIHLVWFPETTVLHPHHHDRPTFAVILDGGFELRLSSPARHRSSLACPPGTILAQPAGERHANHIAAGGARGIVLQPDPGGPTLSQGTTRLLDDLHHFRDGPIATQARGMARELISPDAVTPLALEGLVLEMLSEAARLVARRDPGRTETAPWLRRAVEFVHAHFRENLRIDEIAAAAGVEPGHLTVAFRTVHRVPIGRYVRRLRVDWAADRLAATDTSIARIALEAGYADQPHLTRAFKRATGTTPAAYRRSRGSG